MPHDPSFAPPLAAGVIQQLKLGGGAVADLAVSSFNGNAGAVTGLASFNGRTTAAALPTNGDYAASQVTSAADISSTATQTFSGGIASTHPSGGVGYAPGTGGTVTQATSKSTNVGLNKLCGRITMNSASLAAGATVSFIFGNTNITTSDVVVLTVANNGLSAFPNYRVDVPSIVPGGSGCVIRVTNVSAGTLSEPVVISFMVLKAVVA